MKTDVKDLIPIVEYARMHGLDPSTVKQKCQRGGWKTAVKIGRNWVISKNEPYAGRHIRTMKPDVKKGR